VPGVSEFPRDRVYVGSIDSFDRKLILEATSNVEYCDPGYVLFVRDRTLFAQRFDADRLTVVGDATPVASRIGFHASGFGMFGVSNAGVLVYQGGAPASRLEWLDRRTGSVTPAIDAPAEYATPRLSTDENEILYSAAEPSTGFDDIWLFDRSRRIARRLTSNPADEFCGVLSRDSTQLYFSSNRTGTSQVYVKSVDGGDEKPIVQSRIAEFASTVSSDSAFLVYTEYGATTDIFAFSMKDQRRFPVASSRFDEIQPQFSPDGKSIAYASNETGRYEVYVSPFPALSPRVQISTNGGMQPAWRGDGREIFYVGPSEKLTAVPIERGSTIKAGAASTIASVNLHYSRNANREYDVSADGQKFLLNSTGPIRISSPYTVVSNWTDGLRK
jgi:Tol biopolymer transport system component